MNPKKSVQLDVAWRQDLVFDSSGTGGRKLVLDGDSGEGFSPMEALLSSLCGCMAIDVVLILKKMRVELEGLKIDAEGWRPETQPRFFDRINLKFQFSGKVPPEKAERAVQLSFDTYCSVFHTLRKDLQVEHTLHFDEN